jgi:hypothetical protein
VNKQLLTVVNTIEVILAELKVDGKLDDGAAQRLQAEINKLREEATKIAAPEGNSKAVAEG